MKKRNGLSLLAALMLGFSATASYANILVHAGTDICKELEGNWTGSGSIVIDILGKPTCKYSGSMQITGAESFLMTANLKKTAGACPDATLTIPGICKGNGDIELKTNDAELSGQLVDDGKSVKLGGKVFFTFLGKRITAFVNDLNIHKQ